MNTRWTHLTIDDSTSVLNRVLLAYGYQAWQRILDDDVIFLILPRDQKPGQNDGGYRRLNTACNMKGFHFRWSHAYKQ